MTHLERSWVASANAPDCPFPLNNLPYGVFSNGGVKKLGVAIGVQILDVAGVADLLPLEIEVLKDPRGWNGVMELGPALWQSLRQSLTDLLSEGGAHQSVVERHLVEMKDAELHLPFTVAEYTDFYAGKHHAFNVGTMFRGPENALPPNWLHIPIGYNGRASSVVVSGTPIRRPWGQLKGPNETVPRFAPSQRFDIELEFGAIVGQASQGPMNVDQADAHIFGYVLLNDWSARDIQAWEYQPLGPFQAKATATTISPWIVSKQALEPFKCAAPEREMDLLPHLKDTTPMNYNIEMGVELELPDGHKEVLSRTNTDQLYYSAAQQLAHHTTSGCPMRVGDLLGSGTISGADKSSRGSLLEMSWGGKAPLELANGETRSFIHDNDTLRLFAQAKGDGYCIGFGPCEGKILPALEDPFESKG